jgi:hypothetical protein
MQRTGVTESYGHVTGVENEEKDEVEEEEGVN